MEYHLGIITKLPEGGRKNTFYYMTNSIRKLMKYCSQYDSRERVHENESDSLFRYTRRELETAEPETSRGFTCVMAGKKARASTPPAACVGIRARVTMRKFARRQSRG